MTREDNQRKQQGARLRAARIAAGYRSAREAALQNRWPESSYRAHEAGTRTIGQDDAERYARRFRAAGAEISARAILFDGAEPARPAPQSVPLVGYVGAGAEAHLFAEAQGPFDEVPAPEGPTEDTVAVEIRGDSLGSFFDQWVVYYDDVRSPVTNDLIGKLCVAGLTDGRILIKKIARGERRGRFTLLSQFEPPIYDVTIDWAARVKHMRPRR